MQSIRILFLLLLTNICRCLLPDKDFKNRNKIPYFIPYMTNQNPEHIAILVTILLLKGFFKKKYSF